MKYYVGWHKIEDENHENYGRYELYTTFPHAVDLLAEKKIEFYYQKQHECMVAVVDKVPKDRNIKFYQEFAVNKPAPKQARTQMRRDCDQLQALDEDYNKALEEWVKRTETYREKQGEIKRRIFDRLMEHGQTVKRGRWYHRAFFLDWFRIFSKTFFPKPHVTFDVGYLRALAKRFKKWSVKLESTIKLQSVTIDPGLYTRKVKHCLTAKERNLVEEHYDINQDELEALVPDLPYALAHKIWCLRSPIDEEGNPLYEVHPRTHQSKNPECQECGGKFVKNTNVCRDCGLESFTVKDDGVKSTRTKKKDRRSKILWMQGGEVVKKTSKRKVPKIGQSRY